MLKVTNFRAITGKNGLPYVLCGASQPNRELIAKGVLGSLTSAAGFIQFESLTQANAAIAVLSTLNVQLADNAKADGFDVVVL